MGGGYKCDRTSVILEIVSLARFGLFKDLVAAQRFSADVIDLSESTQRIWSLLMMIFKKKTV